MEAGMPVYPKLIWMSSTRKGHSKEGRRGAQLGVELEERG